MIAMGWNAVNNNNAMYDDVGHGTHVSGTIGATGDNGLGVVGVNWHVTILPCKFLFNDGFGNGVGNTSDAIECLDYYASIKDAGYNIVATNNSWGAGAIRRRSTTLSKRTWIAAYSSSPRQGMAGQITWATTMIKSPITHRTMTCQTSSRWRRPPAPMPVPAFPTTGGVR